MTDDQLIATAMRIEAFAQSFPDAGQPIDEESRVTVADQLAGAAALRRLAAGKLFEQGIDGAQAVKAS